MRKRVEVLAFAALGLALAALWNSGVQLVDASHGGGAMMLAGPDGSDGGGSNPPPDEEPETDVA
jgi:hypothetical protein